MSSLSFLFTKKEGSIQNWYNFYETPDGDDQDIIILGSSTAYASLKPNLINAKLDVSTYNLSSPSINMVQLYYNLKEALKYRKPQMVIVEAHSLDIEPSNVGKRLKFNYQNIDGQKFSINKMNSVFGVFDWRNYINALFPTIRNHHEWANKELLKENIEFIFNEDVERGYRPLAIDDARERIANTKRALPSSYIIPEKNKEYLQYIVDLCNEKNIQLLLLRLPQLHFQDNRAYSKQIFKVTDSIAEKLNIRYHDYNYAFLNTGLSDNDFYDALHVNDNGAEKLTLDLVANVLDGYNLKVNDRFIHREPDFYLENDRFLNSKKLLKAPVILTENIIIAQIFVQKTIEDEYSFFFCFTPDTSLEALKSHKIAFQLFPTKEHVKLLQNQTDRDKEMMSFGMHGYPLTVRNDFIVRAIGFKKIKPKNFRALRLYLSQGNEVSHTLAINNITFKDTQTYLKSQKKELQKENMLMQKTLLDTSFVFNSKIAFSNVSIKRSRKDTFDITIEIDKGKTNIDVLKKWKIALQLHPENPEELHNFNKDQKTYISRGFLVNPIEKDGKIFLELRDIFMKPNQIKLARIYLYNTNNEMTEKHLDIRNFELP